MRITQDMFDSILRIDFKSFIRKVFLEIAGNSKYLDNWHIDLICAYILELINNENDRLIINMPPRYLKSLICSVALPAFLLGLNPKAVTMCVSYNDELAAKFAGDCRRVMESEWYKRLFPKTRLSKSKYSTMDFETTQGGGRLSTSMGGCILGRGAEWIIIDDPIKPLDALSETMRAKINELYKSTLSTRLNNKNNGKIILVMQRLHEDDLTGFILENNMKFKHLKLQAIAEEDETWKIKRPFDKVKTVVREKGEALHPERESIDKLLELKNEMGTMVFAGQYQQDPMPQEGGYIKAKWFRYYNKEELLELIKSGQVKIAHLIQSWDTAVGVNKNNDYSVCMSIIEDTSGCYYLWDVYRAKVEFTQLVRDAVRLEKNFRDKFNKNVKMLIENGGSGMQLIQTLYNAHRIRAKVINPNGDKESRLLAVAYLVENGKCRFPDDAPHWWPAFEKEILTFPNGKHDDQCDALSQALGTKLSGGLTVRRL